MNSKTAHKIVDWFHIASLTEESTLGCLDKTIDYLKIRSEFLEAVRSNLNGQVHSFQEKDKLRHIYEQVRVFEKTLEFRLSWLKPDRAASWTRPLVGNRFGPFGVQLFTEAVLGSYDIRRISQVRERIRNAWQLSSKDPDLLFDDAKLTLWHKLIQIKFSFHKMKTVSFAGLFIDLENFDWNEFENIGMKVDSPNFVLFFKNLSKDLHTLSLQIEDLFLKLWNACESLWEMQSNVQTSDASNLRSDYRITADRIRSEMRDRRQAGRAIPGFISSTEIQALKFMGFEILPDEDLLKSRYRELARKLHPDLNQGKEESFKLLTQSYQVLCKSIFRSP